MSWALIAGGSKGIGLSIARALARRNYNLLLIARDGNILSEVKYEIENTFNIKVEILACDLSLTGSSNLIFNWCADKTADLNILCNAAGMGGAIDFPELSTENLRTMIRMNIESAVVLSALFIPLLKKSAPAYILNVSSIAGFSSLPIKSVYSSSKSALISFSYSLKYILQPEQISVSCLCPGPVFTKPSIKEETIGQLGWIGKQLAVDSEEVGDYGVRQMLKRKMIIVPGRLARLISYILRILPSTFVAHLIYSRQIKHQ